MLVSKDATAVVNNVIRVAQTNILLAISAGHNRRSFTVLFSSSHYYAYCYSLLGAPVDLVLVSFLEETDVTVFNSSKETFQL